MTYPSYFKDLFSSVASLTSYISTHKDCGYSGLERVHVGFLHSQHGDAYKNNISSDISVVQLDKQTSKELLQETECEELEACISKYELNDALKYGVLLLESKNEIFYQLSGFHLGHILTRASAKKRMTDGSADDLPRKSAKLSSNNTVISPTQPSTNPATIHFDRSQLFYRQAGVSKDNNLWFVFNTKDVFGSNNIRSGELRDENIFHLLQQIFPREFRKKITPPHLPKRLQGGIRLLAHHLLKHHPLFPLVDLLNSCCPQKKENLSLDDLIIPYNRVSNFVKIVLTKLLPRSFCGSDDNWKILFDGIGQFIKMQKYESFRSIDVLKRFKITQCEWLAPPPKQSTVSIVSSVSSISPPLQSTTSTDLKKRKELMAQMIFWLFNTYITKLLTTCFYITDHAKCGSKIVYFRHDDWLSASTRMAIECTKRGYTVVTQEYTRDLTLGSAPLKFLPKGNDMRIIAKMNNAVKWEKTKTENGMYTHVNNNASLNIIKEALSFEIRRQSGLTGSSVASTKEAVKNIAHYKRRLGHKDRDTARFYFSKVDIKHCFNTVNQDMLLSILQELFINNNYSIQNYTSIKEVNNKFLWSLKRAVYRSGEKPDSFLKVPKMSIVVLNEKLHRYESPRSLMTLIEEHVKNTTVTYQDKIYRQQTGIPEGSCISTMLCDLLLGHLENEELRPIKEDETGILIRYVDDFLYISCDRQYVAKFDALMTKGFEEYGCYINRQKKLNNLNVPVDEFSWCGLRFSTSTLDVYNDYTNCTLDGIRNNMTVTTAKEFPAKLERSIPRKLGWVPVAGNSYSALCRVIYQFALHCASKIVIYCTELSKKTGTGVNEDYVLRLISEIIQNVLTIFNTGAQVCKRDVTCLMNLGFWFIVKRRKRQYPKVAATLKSICKQVDTQFLLDYAEEWNIFNTKDE